MAAKIYTITSGKGGTGKSIFAVNLAAAISGLAKKTLLIDADLGMANICLMLGLEDSKITLHEVLADEANVADALYDGPNGLKVIPSGLSLQGFKKADPAKLKDVIAEVSPNFEFIVIDTPSGINHVTASSIEICDEVIMVLTPEITSITDGSKMKAFSAMLGKEVAGIVLNRTMPEHDETYREKLASSVDLNVLEVLPEDASIPNSIIAKSPAVANYPYSEISIAMNRCAALLCGIKIPEPKEGKAQKNEKKRVLNTKIPFSQSKK
ncbi:MAG: cell division ATPase MinD [Methanomethylovorans sp.]|uniref:cell division ATPase MinD n=1 Tax=Methanomethylovorans sp. TaxID=2758717 RepID=UPI000AD5CB22|nr:cell division ATPase MinD [Methanomethylovorans sp.]